MRYRVSLVFVSAAGAVAAPSLFGRSTPTTSIEDLFVHYRDTLVTEDPVLDVALVGGVAYVASDEAGLYIVDVSDPDQFVVLGRSASVRHAQTVRVVGERAYVANLYDGLQIIDVSDPAAPAFLGGYDDAELVRSVDVRGDYAFVVDQSLGVIALDVSDPGSPTPVGSYPSVVGAWDIIVRDGIAYVACNGVGLCTLDVTDPANMTAIGTLNTPEGGAYLELDGDVAYMSAGRSGLISIDVSDPGAMTILDAYSTGEGMRACVVRDDRAYLCADEEGLVVLDVSDPSDMVTIGRFQTLGDSRGIDAQGGFAFVGQTARRMQAIDVSTTPSPALIARAASNGRATSIEVSDGFAYIANGFSYGLGIMNVIDPFAPTLIAELPFGGDNSDLRLDGDRVVLANWDDVYFIDVSIPTAPVVQGEPNGFQHLTDVDVQGSYVAFTEFNIPGVLSIAAAPRGVAPTVIGEVETPKRCEFVKFNGDYIYASASGSFYTIDASMPESPALIDTQQIVGTGFAVQDGVIAGPFMYIVGGSPGRLVVMDISDPADPFVVNAIQSDFFNSIGTGVHLQGDRVYVSHRRGLSVFDISEPTQPELVGWHRGRAEDVFVVDDYAFLPVNTEGVDIIDVSRRTECGADIDGDSDADVDDIEAFIAALLDQTPGNADIDGDGDEDAEDIDAFVTAFLAGCG